MAAAKPGDGVSTSTFVQTVVDGIDSLHRRPPLVQVAVGTGVGAVTGYVFTRGGKAVATTAGVSLIILQVCIHRGYIVVDRRRFNKDVRTLCDVVSDQRRNADVVGGQLVDKLVGDHGWLLSGFVAGVLVGFGFA